MLQRLLLPLALFVCQLPAIFAGASNVRIPIAAPDSCPDVQLKLVTDLACGPGNGKVAFRATGGSGAYNFLWSNGSTDSLLTQLDAGHYAVTVSDGTCETYDAADIQFDYKTLTLGQYNYGSRENDLFRATAASPDGAFFYSTGWVSDASFDVDTLRGQNDIWVLKTDKTGQKIWSRTFGGTKADYGNDIVVLPDGTVAVVGTTYSHDGDFADALSEDHAFVLKISPDGQLLQSIKVPQMYDNPSVQLVIGASDGGIILGGTPSNYVPQNPYKTYLWLTRLNADNSWAWSRQYFEAGVVYIRDIVRDVVQGGYVLNFDYSQNAAPIAHLIKVDDNGDIVWQNSDPVFRQGKLAQMADGSFLAGCPVWQNGQNSSALVHVTAAGLTKATVILPGFLPSHVESIVPAGPARYAVLTNKEVTTGNSFADIIVVDTQLQVKSVTALDANTFKSPRFLQETGRDTFFVSGQSLFDDLKRDDWYFRSFWNLPFQPGLIPQDYTLVCPGTAVALDVDSLAIMDAQLTWQFSGNPVPDTVLVGTRDTALNIVTRNAQGCYALAERTIYTDKFNTTLEVESSTCDLPSGRIFLSADNGNGQYHYDWADGSTASWRIGLAPGVYPVTVSDNQCQQHFAPVVTVSDGPMLTSIEQKGFFTRATPGFLYVGEIIPLSDGTPVFWADYPKLFEVNYMNPNQNDRYRKVVAFPDTTFGVLADIYSNDQPNLFHFDRLGQQIGSFHLPVGYLEDITALPGGGYLAFGTYSLNDPNVSKPVLVRLDKNFLPVWVKEFPNPAHPEAASGMVLLPNGSLALAVKSTTSIDLSKHDLRIIVADTSGNLVWSKLFGGENDDQWEGLKATPDGGLIVAAATQSFGGDLAGLNFEHGNVPWLFRISSATGAIEWSRILPGSSALPGFFPDGTAVYPSTSPYSIYATTNSEHLTAYSPATGDTVWSVYTYDAFLSMGTPYCAPNGDILWPHAWYDNVQPGPADGHCCPFADYHVQIHTLLNGQIPSPFDLGTDTTLCIGDTIHVSAAAANAAIVWENNTYDATRDISSAGIYVARAGGVCAIYDTLRVDYCLYPSLPDSITGCAPVVVDGGMPGLVHAWSNGYGGQQNPVNQTGWLSLSVTNLQGQTINDSTFVEVYPVSTYETDQKDLTCFEDQSGEVVVIPSGEGQPYLYLWNTGTMDSVLQHVAVGAYGVTVTDAFGCTFQQHFWITQPNEWVLDIYNNQNTDSTYQLYAHVAGVGLHYPLSFQWSNGDINSIIYTPGGLFSVTVTDALGCVQVDTIDLPALTSGIRNPLTAKSLKIFPNPFSTGFIVADIDQSPEFVEVRDMSGRMMPVTIDATSGTANGLRFSAKAWPAGVYTLLLRWADKVQIGKLIKTGE